MKRIYATIIFIFFILLSTYSYSQDYLLNGHELYNKGEYSDALTKYKAALAVLQSQDVSEADRNYSEIQRLIVRTEKCVKLMESANLYYNTANNIEKYLKAKSTYQQILAINTNDSYSKKRISACDAKIRQLKHIASDNALWNKIKEGNTTKEQYEQYISQFPNGIHVNDAKSGINKIENLGKADEIFEEGKSLYNVRMDDEAVEKFLEAIEMGSIKAINGLGVCYLKGRGVSKNISEALKLFRKAAAQGDPNGQNNIGDCYLTGVGVNRDYAEAIKWFRKAAAQGNALAQNNLGFCYTRGLGVNQSYTEARKWYEKAAAQNYAQAQHNLALCYYKGYGGPQDKEGAIKLFRKAARQGHQDAKNSLSQIGESW